MSRFGAVGSQFSGEAVLGLFAFVLVAIYVIGPLIAIIAAWSELQGGALIIGLLCAIPLGAFFACLTLTNWGFVGSAFAPIGFLLALGAIGSMFGSK